MAGKNRYYVHGDLMENRPGIYFCKLCDYHGERSHFEDPRHTKIRAETYVASISTWNRFQKQRTSFYRRPANAENILAADALRDISDRKASRSPFYLWLLRQTKRDDLIGDLANDVIADSKFPISANSPEEVRAHISKALDSSAALVAADEAWAEFRLKGKRRPGIGKAIRFSIFKRDGYLCQLCGNSAKDGKLELDHKVPVSKGGTNAPENLWVLCFDCNRGKRDSFL